WRAKGRSGEPANAYASTATERDGHRIEPAHTANAPPLHARRNFLPPAGNLHRHSRRARGGLLPYRVYGDPDVASGYLADASALPAAAGPHADRISNRGPRDPSVLPRSRQRRQPD